MQAFNNKAETRLASSLLLPQVVTASLEFIINKALILNTNKVTYFGGVAHKTLTIQLTELSFPLSFTVDSTRESVSIVVSSLTERSDCTIDTSLNTLKKLKANQSLTQLIKQGELDVTGDVKVAQQFSNIAQSLEIDWQSELAKHLGDVPTHKLLHFGNKITKSVATTGRRLQADIGEYLVHEKRLVVTNSQISAFNHQTKELSTKVDMLSQRINKLLTDFNEKPQS
jgi:ubiquinone biosynthesis protein UbiJ